MHLLLTTCHCHCCHCCCHCCCHPLMSLSPLLSLSCSLVQGNDSNDDNLLSRQTPTSRRSCGSSEIHASLHSPCCFCCSSFSCSFSCYPPSSSPSSSCCSLQDDDGDDDDVSSQSSSLQSGAVMVVIVADADGCRWRGL